MTSTKISREGASQTGGFLLSKGEQQEDTRMSIGRLLAILKLNGTGQRAIELLEKIDQEVADMELEIARKGNTSL